VSTRYHARAVTYAKPSVSWAMSPTVKGPQSGVTAGYTWAKGGPPMGHMAQKRRSPHEAGFVSWVMRPEISMRTCIDFARA